MAPKYGQFIQLYKVIWNICNIYVKLFVKLNKIICFFFLAGNRGAWGTQLNIYGAAFLQKTLTAKGC